MTISDKTPMDYGGFFAYTCSFLTAGRPAGPPTGPTHRPAVCPQHSLCHHDQGYTADSSGSLQSRHRVTHTHE